MSLELKRFAVLGLHGKLDIDIPIRDNRLILVGVNGLGKTTVVNLIYFLLTAQWERLLETEFASLAININGQDLPISRQDIQQKGNIAERHAKLLTRIAGRSPFPTKMIQQVLSHPAYQSIVDLPATEIEKASRDLARELQLPSTYVLRMLSEIPRNSTEDLFATTRDPESIATYLSLLKTSGAQQVIYLPTYRRIEQDLKSIFPNLDDDELSKLTSQGASRIGVRNRGHVELIQFGMHDVERKIAEELTAISDGTRSQLTNLTASYLKDIIRNRADAVETGLLAHLEDKVVSDVLKRVDENTLSSADKDEVKSAIGRIRNAGSAYEARDKYLAYFFSRLLEIYSALGERERSIRSLVDTCNRYFERKKLIYNDTDFTTAIVDSDGSPLTWKVLSSGEKQVASLFTHLLLSRDTAQTVIVDEPELSLSVQWQKTLLPDISDSKSCQLLIAVTHSPFIYANKLDAYAIDLSKCISPQSKSALL